MTQTCELTLDDVKEVLRKRTTSGVLRSNSHSAPDGPDDTCEMCVRELRYLACELQLVENSNTFTEHDVWPEIRKDYKSTIAVRTADAATLNT